jgi:capsid protein
MSHALVDPNSKRLSEREPRTIRARYDAAQTNDENRRHWGMADGLSARAANNVQVRRLLRTRARYEAGNNSYLTGIVETLGNDTVGTGPRLQMLCKGPDGKPLTELNSMIEEAVEEWAEEICLDEKLRTMREAACVSGEAFVVFVTNPGLDSPVKLDLSVEEADRFTDPTWQSETSPLWADGIQYDTYGNPVSYRRLLYHPGDLIWGANPLEHEDVPARAVYHFFKPSRPGQLRGIPEFTSALSNWPELRRYCNAVIAAAETAADHAMTIESEAPADTEATDDDPDPMDIFELKKRMATVLPKGWKMSQTKAEQPTTTYPTFVDKKVAEAARCLNMPFTIAALDSSNSNLSARYLDSQIYAKAIKIIRKKLQRLLNRVLDLWLTEASRIPGFLPGDVARFPHRWYWPNIVEHADPDKVASGQAQRLKNGTSCLPDECAENGADWEETQEKAAASLGMTLDDYRARLRDSIFEPKPAPLAATPPRNATPPAKDKGADDPADDPAAQAA